MPDTDTSHRPLTEMLSLAGRGAVVTGAARGIGAATVMRLAEVGASVVAADRDLEGARAVAEAAAKRYGHSAHAVQVDLTDGGQIRTMIDTSADLLGRIDILVNNAGVFPITPLKDLTDEAWDQVIAINLRSILIASREVSRRMIDDGRGGVIVSTSSTAGYRAGGSSKAHYVATKHGVRGLTKSLAVELGEHGIRVLDVAPTLTETPGVAEVLGAGNRTAHDERLARMAGTLPLRRVAVPDDIARVIVFCATDVAAMMTGVTVPVDGGHLAL